MMSSDSLKQLIKQCVRQVHTYRYHCISNRMALATLKELEREKGKLGSIIKKQANAYAINVLGWKGYAPWLYVYAIIHGSFKKGWIPDNYYGMVVVPKIQGEYGKTSFLKPWNNLLFKQEISPDVAYFVNGFWFGKNFNSISSEDIENVLFTNSDTIVCKLDHSFQGKGVFVYDKDSFKRETLEYKGNAVVQKYIEQHSFFNSFLLDSVATIRMTTIVDNHNVISLRASYVRLGRKGDTHVKSKNHIRVPIDLESGMLYSEGYLANWKTIDKHPDSKITFSNKIIPHYKECVQLVLKLHKTMPLVRSIGWDLTIDHENKPVVMEWNGYSNDIKFSEATQGPCFTDLGWEHFHLKD